MAQSYCEFWSRDSIKKLNGKDPCRGCDVRAVETAGYEGKLTPDDFPKLCPYRTENLASAQAAAVAWKVGQAERERQYNEARLRAEMHTS